MESDNVSSRSRFGSDIDTEKVKYEDEEDVVKIASNVSVNSCNFFVIKKKRRCRMNRLAGQEYCAEHVPTISVSNGETQLINDDRKGVMDRMPCPLDSKHTVAVSKLNEHLKKCNSRPPDNKAYYQESANTYYKPDNKEELNILTMDQEEKVKLIIKLIEFHQAQIPEIDNHFGIHEDLMQDFVRTDVGENALRHSTQIGSIAKILEDYGLLKDSTCFIEFGSGRGGLSYGLARVVKARGLKNCKFVLIDRTSPRYKKDNLAKTSEYKEVTVERIKISIEHLLVGKLPGISKYENIVGVTKHLCGSGTDVALRSLLELTSNSERHKVRGLVFATCCHHRIEYVDFVGNEFITTEFSNGNFRALRQIAAWATNGDYKSSFIKDYISVNKPTLKFFIDAEEKYPEIRLKKTMGRLVKEIMDYCRLKYIVQNGESMKITCKLINYVDIATTRENVAIVAYPNEN